MNQRKKILFITGTRADYGKIKPIMQKKKKKKKKEYVFVVCLYPLLEKKENTEKRGKRGI